MLVIIHGWSDNYESFKTLAKRLREWGVADQTIEINLGNYVSMDDDVRFDDLVIALDRAWDRHGLSRKARSVDVVVHSTGGLVLRDWVKRYFSPTTVPVYRLLMLAPANFGSPLAHSGRAFLGRAIKGWKGEKLFQTGTHILKGLELASPYTWHLALHDRLGGATFFGPGRMLATVLVGNSGYGGISAIANKPGSDGTVRISTANLNCALVEMDFNTDPMIPIMTRQESLGRVCFGLMDKDNHSTIAAKDRGPKADIAPKAIKRALTINDSNFESWCDELDSHTARVTSDQSRRRGDHYDAYQNVVFLVVDQFGHPIKDYIIEFYIGNARNTRRRRAVTAKLQEDIISNVHAYGDNAAFRSFLINCTRLEKLLDEPAETLEMSLTATPEFTAKANVGFRSYTDEDIGSVSLSIERVRQIFKPHTTLLVKITLRRYQAEQLFEFHSFG